MQDEIATIRRLIVRDESALGSYRLSMYRFLYRLAEPADNNLRYRLDIVDKCFKIFIVQERRSFVYW